MAFTILPAFNQTTWFRSLCRAAFLAFLWRLHQLRVQQLRREERKLREAIETIPAMAWITGPDGTVQFVNRRWVEYTGLSQLGKVGEVGELAIHPEDLDRSVRRMGASLASGEPFEEEMLPPHRRGVSVVFEPRRAAAGQVKKGGEVVRCGDRHSRSQACGAGA
jgi:PAS domain S-box-containing protein